MDAPKIAGGGVLGVNVDGPRRELDVFELPTTVREVEYYSDECTALCPATGQPDYYEVAIKLSGSAVGLESKSLKLYLTSFREEGMFCEQFASVIAEYVRSVTSAAVVKVDLYQKARGGVRITARARIG